MNHTLALFFAFLAAGLVAPAYAESVVINEIEMNPLGDDTGSVTEWVELFNPSGDAVDIGGWTLTSDVLKRTLTIPDGTMIGPGEFLTYPRQQSWFADFGDSVTLYSSDGEVVDRTPSLRDHLDDFTTWQRIPDGHDSDSADDWEFKRFTVGATNVASSGVQRPDAIAVTVSSDKASYVFGETAMIAGSVSEEVNIYKPYFAQEPIRVLLVGPDFRKDLELYPDLDLNYEAELDLHRVQGIGKGDYDVYVTYANATAETSFSVGSEPFARQEQAQNSLEVTVGQPEYLPGQFASFTAVAGSIVPLEGLEFVVSDPFGIQVSKGTLYPVDGKFSARFYLSNIDSEPGTYAISATYADQTAAATFEVAQDIKENAPVSLWTDRQAYALGDTVMITGRVNHAWVPSLDLEIIQTKHASIAGTTDNTVGFKIGDTVRPHGNGTFAYSFTIPDNEIRLGAYKISVSKEIGTASAVIQAVPDPDAHVSTHDPLVIDTDKETYDIGETMSLTGFVKDPSTSAGNPIGTAASIRITAEDGSPVGFTGPNHLSSANSDNDYALVAILESSGRYSADVDIAGNVFEEGTYVVTVSYGTNDASRSFEVADPLSSNASTMSLDKDVYGLGETVTLAGTIRTDERVAYVELVRPDGATTVSATPIDNHRYSWTWDAPIAGGEMASENVLGIYRVTVDTDIYSDILFFKVSEDPENDRLSDIPIFVSTEKSLYKPGQKLNVLGNVVAREYGGQESTVPQPVHVRILDGAFPYREIQDVTAYPDQGGNFAGVLEIPATVFSQGPYTVRASYLGSQATAGFAVANDPGRSLYPASLELASDRAEYHPGQAAVLSGHLDRLVYVDGFVLDLIKESDGGDVCGPSICGESVASIPPLEPSSSGSFEYRYDIPGEGAVGSYELVVDSDIGTESVRFAVIERPPGAESDVMIEKENSITEASITIPVRERTADGETLSPRVVTGSMIVPGGQEADVNLMVSASDGTCVIGPGEGCLVRGSTQMPGQLYETVEIGGQGMNVRYTGADARLEKFSILPESPGEFLPDSEWDVEVLKGDQSSRFYYKVTYKTR